MRNRIKSNFFADQNVEIYFEEKRQSAQEQLKKLTELSTVQDPKFIEELIDKYSAKVPQLKLDKVTMDKGQDVELDLRDFAQNGYFSYPNKRYPVQGTLIRFYIPYDGDSKFFHCTPSSFGGNVPHAKIENDQVVLEYETVNVDVDSIQKKYNSDVNLLNRNLSNLKNDANKYNTNLSQEIPRLVNERANKISSNNNLPSLLGFPLRERQNAPQTYRVPEDRKPVTLVRSTRGSEDLNSSEAYLNDSDYENILRIIRNMSHVMELSPKAFETMGEEMLRFHFLVQLNGQYEGQATGETFNFGGKTDILIRHNGKNIFIAECKYWQGEKVLLETIDQLLGYLSWRDTKTAIVIFNKNKGFSSVLNKIRQTILRHPCFVSEVHTTSESEIRYQFHQPNDKSRLLVLTLMAFDVPKVTKEDTKDIN